MNRHYLNNKGFYKLAQSIKDYINRKITGYAKLGTASTKDFTTYVSPTQTEQLPVSSSVYSAMTNMLRGAYHPAGSKTIAELTSDLLVKANLGNVYKITEDGVTSDLFIGGAGQTIKTGDNAVVLYASEDTYMFSLESGVVDLDAYQKKELTQAVEGANTVENALVALSSGKVSTDLVPSNASSSNKLVTSSNLRTVLYVGPHSSQTVMLKRNRPVRVTALYFGGICEIAIIVYNFLGANTITYKSIIFSNTAFSSYSLSVDNSTGILTCSSTGSETIQFIIEEIGAIS